MHWSSQPERSWGEWIRVFYNYILLITHEISSFVNGPDSKGVLLEANFGSAPLLQPFNQTLITMNYGYLVGTFTNAFLPITQPCEMAIKLTANSKYKYGQEFRCQNTNTCNCGAILMKNVGPFDYILQFFCRHRNLQLIRVNLTIFRWQMW